MGRPKGTGSIRQIRKGVWRASCETLPDRETGARRRISAQGPTRAIAQRRLKDKLNNQTSLAPDARMTLGEWMESWMRWKSERLTPNSRRAYRGAIRRIDGMCAARRLDQLNTADIIAIRDGLRQWSPKTASLTWGVLTTTLDAAREEGLISRNPARRFDPPRAIRRPMGVLGVDQAARLIDREPDPMWRFNWALAFMVGLRQGERLGLTFDEIGRDGTVTIRHQLQRLPEATAASWPLGTPVIHLEDGWWLCPPKTATGRRMFRLTGVLADLWEEWRGVRATIRSDLPLVFLSSRGLPLGREAERHHWDMALERIGIINGADGIRYRPHSARHTADSLMAMLGAPENIRLALIGHADPVMDGVYLHADAEQTTMLLERAGRVLTSAAGRGGSAATPPDPAA